MKIRAMLFAAAALVLVTAGPALAQSSSSGSSNGSSNGSSAGGSSVSGGSSSSNASISVSGGGAVGVTQGAVASGSSASGSQNSGSNSGGGSSSGSSSSGGAGSGQTVGATAADDGTASAVAEGVVDSGLQLPSVPLESQTAAEQGGMNPLTWVAVALIVIGFVVLYRRLPRGRAMA